LILALLVGLAFGFFGSMPIAGPTAVVIVSKGLDNQARAGVFIAIGAAAAESVYAFMAFWGLTAILHRYPVLLPASRLVGALLLFGLGSYFALRKGSSSSSDKPAEPARAGYRNLLFGLSLTAVNPTLLVTWTAAVGAAHAIGALRDVGTDAFPFAAGAATGIVSWFGLFLWLLSHFRSRVGTATVDRVIRGIGVLLIVVGLGLAVRAVVTWHPTEKPATQGVAYVGPSETARRRVW
jgi:threonine/homoserine/homoserine lactone efflux protein